MAKYASKVVDQAKAWLGKNEKDGSHKEIIDVYNSHRPLARGYKVSYTDAWCAAFVSAVAVKLGYTDIMPTECSCNKLIEKAKSMGIWIEDESITPTPGMLVLYDWDDKSASGDCKGGPEHIGVVEKVENGKITVIEGNHDGDDADRIDGVERRVISVNGRYLRGFIAPKYDVETNTEPKEEKEEANADFTLGMRTLKKGCEGEDVRALQTLLIGYGYSCGPDGADGDFGSNTDKALRAYQKANGLEVDGICGPKTWAKLLGIG